MAIRLLKYDGASLKTFRDVERGLRISLPRDYGEFVQKYDGATPEENVHQDHDDVNVDRFIPVSEIGSRADGVEGFPRSFLPIAESPGGNFVCMSRADFSIWFWDHEWEGDRKLAKSFGEFLQKLVPFDASSIQLKPGQVLSGWIDPDFKPEWD